MIDINGVKILNDDDVVAHLKMEDAVESILNVFKKVKEGRFVTPPRHHVKFDNGSIVFTVGGDRKNGNLGFRVYDTFCSDIVHNQFVAVFDGTNGFLKGIIIGEQLGAYRTGAIGGAAIKLLSKENSSSIGLIGSGLQAKTQILAACAVRQIKTIKVFSRTRENCENFVTEMKGQVEAELIIVKSAKECVSNVDIIITATNSSVPVFDADWISKGCHINSVGPKFRDRHELDFKVALKARSIFTDSLEQLRNYPIPHFLKDTPLYSEIKCLSDLGKRLDSSNYISLFLSVGLSGTEPILGGLLLNKL